jgi:hypothetical protein
MSPLVTMSHQSPFSLCKYLRHSLFYSIFIFRNRTILIFSALNSKDSIVTYGHFKNYGSDTLILVDVHIQYEIISLVPVKNTDVAVTRTILTLSIYKLKYSKFLMSVSG